MARNYAEQQRAPIPKRNVRTSRRGYSFRDEDVVWKLSKDHQINWQRCSIPAGQVKLLEGFRSSLANYAEQLSAGYAELLFRRLNHLWPHCENGQVTVKAINDWRKELGEKRMWWLGTARSFLLQWKDWGFYGVDEKAALLLDKLVLPGSVKGVAVRIACPYAGPFTRQEYQAIGLWLNGAWRHDEITLSDCALLRTFMETGRRPTEITALRIGDLISELLPGGDGVGPVESHRLLVHTAKGRGGLLRDPSRSTELPISDDLYDLLHNVARQTKERLEELWGCSIPEASVKHLPLFVTPQMRRFQEVAGPEEAMSLMQTTPDYFHLSSSDLHSMFRGIAHKCTAVSERTNDYMLITPYRFRRTLGTVLAQHGYNEYEIAEALGHSDTQHVQVYVENSALAYDRYQEKMEPVFEPLLRAFRGELIVREQQDAQGQPFVHVFSDDDEPEEAGRCGSFAQCHRGWYTCYTCVKFRPYVDADHESALRQVQEEHARTKSLGYKDSMVTGLEVTMVAIEEVIRQCRLSQSDKQ